MALFAPAHTGANVVNLVLSAAMGFPVTMFPVLFAIPRTSGWISQWEEMLLDPEQKISRPRQVYLGYPLRSYIPLDRRG